MEKLLFLGVPILKHIRVHFGLCESCLSKILGTIKIFRKMAYIIKLYGKECNVTKSNYVLYHVRIY